MKPRLLLTLLALVALTLTTFALAHVPTGAAGAPIALAIAAVKAALVLVVFMEIQDAGTTAWIAVSIAVGFIALLALGAVADVALR